MKRITSEQLKLVIHSLTRPHGGGVEYFLREHSDEFAELLQRLVLPELEKREELASALMQHQRYLEEEYEDEPDHELWDGCD